MLPIRLQVTRRPSPYRITHDSHDLLISLSTRQENNRMKFQHTLAGEVFSLLKEEKELNARETVEPKQHMSTEIGKIMWNGILRLLN